MLSAYPKSAVGSGAERPIRKALWDEKRWEDRTQGRTSGYYRSLSEKRWEVQRCSAGVRRRSSSSPEMPSVLTPEEIKTWREAFLLIWLPRSAHVPTPSHSAYNLIS